MGSSVCSSDNCALHVFETVIPDIAFNLANKVVHDWTSFTKPGPAILTWPISFAPCLLISIIKSTKWRFLSSLFINRSFNTFRSIQRETERNSVLGSSWSSFCGTLSLISQLIYSYSYSPIRWYSQNVSFDSRKWLIKHLFPPSSCKKQINKQNSYLLTVRFRSGIRYARVQTFFAGSVCTQWYHSHYVCIP